MGLKVSSADQTFLCCLKVLYDGEDDYVSAVVIRFL